MDRLSIQWYEFDYQRTSSETAVSNMNNLFTISFILVDRRLLASTVEFVLACCTAISLVRSQEQLNQKFSKINVQDLGYRSKKN